MGQFTSIKLLQNILIQEYVSFKWLSININHG